MKFLADFFPIILFFAAYKFQGIYVATAVAIAASFIQVGYQWLKHRQVEKMHLVTLIILVVFGGLTIILQDRTFIMWKPSVINWLFGGVFLASLYIGRQPLLERIMGDNIAVPGPVWRRLNAAWGIFFILLGFLNLYVASDFFTAEATLIEATGMTDIDLDDCPGQFQSQPPKLEMCLNAHRLEESWVNFKMFGMMGLTMAFIILQAFYLARHIRDPDDEMEET